jgi:hypothetical protein
VVKGEFRAPPRYGCCRVRCLWLVGTSHSSDATHHQEYAIEDAIHSSGAVGASAYDLAAVNAPSGRHDHDNVHPHIR